MIYTYFTNKTVTLLVSWINSTISIHFLQKLDVTNSKLHSTVRRPGSKWSPADVLFLHSVGETEICDTTPSTSPWTLELPLELNNSIPKHNHFKIVVLGRYLVIFLIRLSFFTWMGMRLRLLSWILLLVRFIFRWTDCQVFWMFQNCCKTNVPAYTVREIWFLFFLKTGLLFP